MSGGSCVSELLKCLKRTSLCDQVLFKHVAEIPGSNGAQTARARNNRRHGVAKVVVLGEPRFFVVVKYASQRKNGLTPSDIRLVGVFGGSQKTGCPNAQHRSHSIEALAVQPRCGNIRPEVAVACYAYIETSMADAHRKLFGEQAGDHKAWYCLSVTLLSKREQPRIGRCKGVSRSKVRIPAYLKDTVNLRLTKVRSKPWNLCEHVNSACRSPWNAQLRNDETVGAQIKWPDQCRERRRSARRGQICCVVTWPNRRSRSR